MEAKKRVTDEISNDRSEQLLIQRAKRMAARVDEQSIVQANTAAQSILIFTLGRERFAFRMKSVSAVVPMAKVTTVPTADPKILGVMVVKGEVNCIFDLARVLDLSRTNGGDPSGDKAGSYVVILRMPGFHIGFSVDHVESIDNIEVEASTSESSTHVHRELAVGRSFVKPRSSAALVLIENFESLLGTLLHEENQA